MHEYLQRRPSLIWLCIVLCAIAHPAASDVYANSSSSKAGRVIVAQANVQQADDLVNRGNALADKKEYDRALTAFSEAIRLDPQNAYAYNSRADTLREAGKAAQGLSDAEKALQLDSDNADFWDTRAQIFQALGRRQEAIADYKRALELDANMAETRERLKRLGVSP